MKILALDGGGVFGRVQAHILADANCFDKFDAFAGTSIGAVQVLSIALGNSAAVRPEFFDQWMPKVFKTTWLHRVNLFQSEYPDKGLNAALQSVLGSATFGQAKKPVFIAAADVGQKTMKVFSSADFDDQLWPAWEICRASTAAETYFPSWKGYADGGVYANNPSMVALAAAVRALGAKIEDVEILSIGTGDNSTGADSEPWLRFQWALWMIRAMLNGSANKMHDYFVKSLPVKRYTRIQFARDPDWKMDDPRSMYLAERKWAVEIHDAVKIVRDF